MNETQLRASDIKLGISERKRILVAAKGILEGRSPVDGPGMVPACTSWSVDDVQTWLIDLRLDTIKDLFAKAKVGQKIQMLQRNTT